MKLTEKEKLLFRRQFLLTTKEISSLDYWNIIKLTNEYVLYTHPDLPTSRISKSEHQIILLGDIFDPFSVDLLNNDMLNSLIEIDNIDGITEFLYNKSGRYVLIIIFDNQIYLINDPSASRKIFYSTSIDLNWCGSQPHFLAQSLGIKKSTKENVQKYYKSDAYSRGYHINIGEDTVFDDIRQLRPNHYLVLNNIKTIRFWPNRESVKYSLKEGVEKASQVLRGSLESFSKRYKLMLPVTGGTDSRLLLAASKNIVNSLVLYINKHPKMRDDHFDLKVSQRLFTRLGLKSIINEYQLKVDDEFEEIYRQNTVDPVMKNLGLIYNVYYKNFSEFVNLPGSFNDISRNFFSTYKKDCITADVLREIYSTVQNYPDDPGYYLEHFEKWLNENKKQILDYGYRILDLFNWEERHGNWATAFQTDKDISQEELMPFNNRFYMDICLGVDPKFRDLDYSEFHKSMIKYLWSDLLIEPLYPKSWIRYYLKKTKLYCLARRIFREF